MAKADFAFRMMVEGDGTVTAALNNVAAASEKAAARESAAAEKSALATELAERKKMALRAQAESLFNQSSVGTSAAPAIAQTVTEEILDDKCRSPGMDANGRICSARVDADRHLIHLGWCWGTEKRDTVEADSYWLRCSRVWTRK